MKTKVVKLETSLENILRQGRFIECSHSDLSQFASEPFVYHLRHDEYALPATIEKSVRVDFWGVVIAPFEIRFPAEGRFDLTEDQGYEIVSKQIDLDDYIAGAERYLAVGFDEGFDDSVTEITDREFARWLDLLQKSGFFEVAEKEDVNLYMIVESNLDKAIPILKHLAEFTDIFVYHDEVEYVRDIVDLRDYLQSPSHK